MIDIIAAAGGQGWFPNFPDATPGNVAYARAKGLKVGAWTVNRREDMQRLSDLDAICTDRPDLLLGCSIWQPRAASGKAQGHGGSCDCSLHARWTLTSAA